VTAIAAQGGLSVFVTLIADKYASVTAALNITRQLAHLRVYECKFLPDFAVAFVTRWWYRAVGLARLFWQMTSGTGKPPPLAIKMDPITQ